MYRKPNGWSGGYVEWIEGDIAYLSVVFSWQLAAAYQRAVWLKTEGYTVYAGGPAVVLNPTVLDGVAILGGSIPALVRHNPNATFTSRGCIRQCSFCAVPKIEGAFVELDIWPIKPIVCDNNFLAASRKHFDAVVDSLKSLSGVDFNQGLDIRLLTDYHASRLAELDLYAARLAWDNTGTEAQFLQAFERLTKNGIPAHLVRVYVLIGYHDTPEDALHRLETVRRLGGLTNPMRYQALNAIRRNAHKATAPWTDRELTRYMRYWSNTRKLSRIPFAEFDTQRARGLRE